MTTATDVRTGTHAREFFNEAGKICAQIDVEKIEGLAEGLAKVRERGGRLFIVGVGGSAGNASHAVNDFRKIVRHRSYSPVDNVSELTARTNDEGWETIFSGWLKVSGSTTRTRSSFLGRRRRRRTQVSVNLVKPSTRKKRGAKVIGIVGRPAATPQGGDIVVVIPQVNPGGHAALGGLPSRRLALPGQPPEAPSTGDEVVSAKLGAAVFLDRDGVLCRSRVPDGRSYAPTTLDDFRIYPDAPPWRWRG